MSLLTRLIGLHRDEPQREDTSAEAIAAVEAARCSIDQADRDLEEQRRQLPEARALTRTLRAHNDANHYAAWLSGPALDPRRT